MNIDSFAPNLFTGKTAYVSGGTSGIGLAIATAFARLGAIVTASGSSSAKVAALTAEPPISGMHFVQLDVTNRRAAEKAFEGMQQLDILVNAAGIARPDKEYEAETFQEVMDVNLNSVMWLSSAAKPLLAVRGGNIINTASMLSYLTDIAVPAYGASKAGVLGLTRHLAHAWAAEGIRVNAVTPGYIATAMTTGLQEDSHLTGRILNRCAIERWGTPDDVVGAALFLASPAAAYITATDIAVDGGFVSGGF
ncbi:MULTISPECIES: SDR family NAD(P)-dependent oxidoreductase [Brucella]|uniref:Putative short-chain dehydrogenase n=1 Tax=Brucella lupini TaxID=255457 RepID=A0A256GJ21_9HYPH|nr:MULTISPECIES: SDR family oxidoreductase [Brucella]KAB2702870.1 SDR family oxidoreductase [Brucella lupini]KAB2728009.1 SDR family oxidoreductase [Brucella anthropi]KAB2745181.1 SDR family oxidoreductase [Brucella anthropi]KAB2800015.1 SDR family oxidoreductase [Brucella anthropi]KAB2805606.1 SDR family oxidoreductase [Brucella anthropi]